MKQSFVRKHRIYMILGSVALVMLVASIVSEVTVASNMAFKLNKAINGGNGNFGVNFLALPFRTPITTAKDVCNVFGTTSSLVLVQKLTGTGAPLNFTCDQVVAGFSLNDGGGPGLTAGVGLRIENRIVPATVLSGIIVGSHVPGGGVPGTYTQPAAGVGFIGKKLYGVPYHTTDVSAKSICNEGGLDSIAPAASLRRIDTATGTPFSFTCDQAVAGFPLVLGEAVEITQQAPAVAWAPVHF